MSTSGLALVTLCAMGLHAGPLDCQDLVRTSDSRVLLDEEELTVRAEFLTGDLSLRVSSENQLYRTTALYYDEFLAFRSRYQDGVLTVGLDPTNIVENLAELDENPPSITLALNPDVALDLRIELGPGTADLDLGGLNVHQAELRTGANAAQLYFSRPTTGRCAVLTVLTGAADVSLRRLANSRCAKIEITGGGGHLLADFSGTLESGTHTELDIQSGLVKIDLRFPRALGVSLTVDRTLSSLELTGMVRREGGYYSDGYDAATATLHVALKSVLGDISIGWIDDR